MEIDAKVRRCSDRRLLSKYERAVYAIQRAFALYPFEEVALSFNGGKDSTVLLHLLRAGFALHSGSSQDSFRMRTIYFKSSCAFPEIDQFTYETARSYSLPLEIIDSDFKTGLEDLLMKKPTKAIFLGTRLGDPNAVGQEQFSPSSPGWPPFMRVNPILDWSYRDIWSFIRTCEVEYCSLYDQGYTSIGSIHDTVPNDSLSVADSSGLKSFKPAHTLLDGRLERAGRMKKGLVNLAIDCARSNGMKTGLLHQQTRCTASIILVGDDILFGFAEDKLASTLCKKLHTIGWQVSRIAVVRNERDAVAEEVGKCKSSDDMVFLCGGLGPLPSDVSLAGVAEAFGVRLVPDEDFDTYLRQLTGKKNSPGDPSEMALLPEGITELVHLGEQSVPLIKCKNVILLAATNVNELHKEWDDLKQAESGLFEVLAFSSKHIRTALSDVEISPVLSELCTDFPDMYIGCRRCSRKGPLVVSFVGKDSSRLEAAAERLLGRFPDGTFQDLPTD